MRAMKMENSVYFPWATEELTRPVGLSGSLLIADEGSCPGPRGLTIYRLPDGATVWTDTYDPPLVLRRRSREEYGRLWPGWLAAWRASPEVLEYWKWTGERDVNYEERIKSKAMDTKREQYERVALDLRTMRLRKLGERYEAGPTF